MIGYENKQIKTEEKNKNNKDKCVWNYVISLFIAFILMVIVVI